MRNIHNISHNFFVDTNFSGIGKKLKKERIEGIPVQKNLPLFTAALVSRILTQGVMIGMIPAFVFHPICNLIRSCKHEPHTLQSYNCIE